MKNKKHLLILLFVICHLNIVRSQQNMTPDTTKIYFIVDSMPKYQGGVKALKKYFKDNTNYKITSKGNNSFYLSLNIYYNGKAVIDSIYQMENKICVDELSQIVKNMPTWTPAVKDKRNVNSNYIIPLRVKSKK